MKSDWLISNISRPIIGWHTQTVLDIFSKTFPHGQHFIVKMLGIHSQRLSPKVIFTRDNVENVQFQKLPRLGLVVPAEVPQASMRAERCGLNWLGDRALRLKQAKEASAVVRTDFRSGHFGNWVVNRKLPLGKIPLGICRLGKRPLAKYLTSSQMLSNLHFL